MFVIYDPKDTNIIRAGNEICTQGNLALEFIQFCDYICLLKPENRTYKIIKDRTNASNRNKEIWVGHLPIHAQRKLIRMLKLRDGVES
jgi:hypothetical protein